MLGWVLRQLHEPVYRHRIEELVRRITPHLRAGDRVLDVGCGFGSLGRALMDGPQAPEGLVVEGLEKHVRDGTVIKVTRFDGGDIAFEDNSFDVVTLADVLHHVEQADALLAECARVARRFLIIKDHRIDAPLGKARVSVLDWLANRPYRIDCLYHYRTLAQWHEWFASHRLPVEQELLAMRLYPTGYNLLFAGPLQYMAVLRTGEVEGGARRARSEQRATMSAGSTAGGSPGSRS